MWRDDLIPEEQTRAYDESYHEGGHIAHLDIAIRMLKDDWPLDKVARYTDLTQEKLFELRERVRTRAQKA